MKLLVLGSSDTSGEALPDPSLAWPRLVGRELGDLVGEAVDVTDVHVVPAGPRALPRVEAALEGNQPDVAVFAFGAYHFVVATVGLRVRRRYGERVYRLFRRIEVRFESLTASPSGARARLNHAGRRLARRIIGAEPLASREEVVDIQLGILRRLAQREGLVVVLLAAPPLGDTIERANRGANQRLAEHREYLNGVGRDYGFLIANCLPGFAAVSADPLRHSDGVHKNTTGHRIQADAVMAALRTPPSPFAAAGGPGSA